MCSYTELFEEILRHIDTCTRAVHNEATLIKNAVSVLATAAKNMQHCVYKIFAI